MKVTVLVSFVSLSSKLMELERGSWESLIYSGLVRSIGNNLGLAMAWRGSGWRETNLIGLSP